MKSAQLVILLFTIGLSSCSRDGDAPKIADTENPTAAKKVERSKKELEQRERAKRDLEKRHEEAMQMIRDESRKAP